MYLCTQKDETRLVSSVGLEYDATNVGVGSSNFSRVTSMLYGVTVSTSDSESGSGGSNPSEATTLGTLADLVYAEDWKSSERGSTPRGSTDNALWYNGSTTGFGSVSEGSTPSNSTKFLLYITDCQSVGDIFLFWYRGRFRGWLGGDLAKRRYYDCLSINIWFT